MYRADIDGVRAIAVMLVVFFHLQIAPFSGGYVGVDVFFVISGFLITRLIRGGIDDNTFTFSNFYMRRVRRLFPALFVTVTGSLFAAYWIFSPELLASFGKSQLYAILSVSNFLFWSESGYFDIEAQLKPLLHTWSLSVEEQFYLVWPSLLLGLMSIRRTWVVIAFLIFAGTASLVLTEWLLESNPASAFYLAPSRVMELAIGALLVWVVDHQPRNKLYLEPLALLGLIGIVYPAVAYSEETEFPGVSALLPCLGTALLIYAGRARYVGTLLSNRLSVGLGLISYSLYLFHWPLLVFYKYWKAEDLVEWEKWLLVLLSSALATLSYFAVEMPFRKGASRTNTKFGLAAAGLAASVTFVSVHAWANEGWPRRFDGPRSIGTFNLGELMSQRLEYAKKVRKKGSFSGRGTRILVVGDSHSFDVAIGLHLSTTSAEASVARLALDDVCGLLLIHQEELMAQHEQRRCERIFERFEKSRLTRTADLIIATNFWDPGAIEALPAYVDYVREVAKPNAPRIVLTTRSPSFRGMPRSALEKYESNATIEEINRAAFASIDPIGAVVDEAIKEYARASGLPLIEKQDLICSERRCDFFIHETALGFWDPSHWTLEGARIFGRRFLDELNEIRESH